MKIISIGMSKISNSMKKQWNNIKNSLIYLSDIIILLGTSFSAVFISTLPDSFKIFWKLLFITIPIIGLIALSIYQSSVIHFKTTRKIPSGKFDVDLSQIKEFQKKNWMLISFIILFIFILPIITMVLPSQKFMTKARIVNSNEKVLAYVENDTINLKYFSAGSSNKHEYFLEFAIVCNSISNKEKALPNKIEYSNNLYLCRVPVAQFLDGDYHFYFNDKNSNHFLTSNIISINKSKLTYPKFHELRLYKNELLIKYENPSFNICSTVKLNCKNLKHDYSVVFNRKPIEFDSIAVPIHFNEPYYLELLIFDSLNHQIQIDTTFTITNKK